MRVDLRGGHRLFNSRSRTSSRRQPPSTSTVAQACLNLCGLIFVTSIPAHAAASIMASMLGARIACPTAATRPRPTLGCCASSAPSASAAGRPGRAVGESGTRRSLSPLPMPCTSTGRPSWYQLLHVDGSRVHDHVWSPGRAGGEHRGVWRPGVVTGGGGQPTPSATVHPRGALVQ